MVNKTICTWPQCTVSGLHLQPCEKLKGGKSIVQMDASS